MAVAVVVIGIGGLGYFNPALASKIPLIGKIFEKVEDDITYSGETNLEMFQNISKVGLTAGASTPVYLLEKVREYILEVAR